MLYLELCSRLDEVLLELSMWKLTKTSIYNEFQNLYSKLSTLKIPHQIFSVSNTGAGDEKAPQTLKLPVLCQQIQTFLCLQFHVLSVNPFSFTK